MKDILDLDSIARFVEAAKMGKRAGGKASSGERAALLLARKAPAISALMQDIDSGLKDGFCALLMGLDWPDTRHHFLNKLPR